MHKISIAPMLDCTDRHYRFLMRLITRHATLYTEMITTRDVLGKYSNEVLKFDSIEHPIVLQIGGSDPQVLAQCAIRVAEAGFDAINLNVGCPSDRVQQGGIGACLMLKPDLVAECIFAMQKVVKIPVTVKCRLGVDEQDSYESLYHFIEKVSQAGCSTFIIHARKAWLKGLSPKQNREIPPLQYDKVYRLKQDFPSLRIIINGGVTDLVAAQQHLSHCDGVMMGRAAYSYPFCMSEVDALFYNATNTPLGQEKVVLAYADYIQTQLKQGVKLSKMTRHLLGFFHGKAKSSHWRRHLSGQTQSVGVNIIYEALARMANGADAIS